MLAIMVAEGPPTRSGARKSPRERTKANVAPASRPGMESGRMTRKKVARRSEERRGFNQRAGNVLERGIDGKENEGRIDVREHEDHSEGAIEKETDRFVGDVEILEKSVEHAV